jgi:sarcosine oxidase subunit beta
MRVADIVIIGGGIVGSSIAYHLTKQGCRNILILEREPHQGLGSTGKSMGGVRAQFATDVNIRMSLYSIPFFPHFENETGHPTGYKPHGYLFAATTETHLDYLRTNLARQQALGLQQARMLTREEIADIFPPIRSDDILGGAFCPTDGFVDPHSMMTAFMTVAEEQGAKLERHTQVLRILTENGAVTGVETAKETIATRIVVNAAGVWASELAKSAGADLPIKPLRRMLVPTEPFPGIPDRLPMIVDMSTGFHFRPEGVGLLLAWNDPQEPYGYKTYFDPAFIEKVLTRAADRVPAFAELAVNPRRCWAGMYDMSPDKHSILGPAPEVRGLFYANGFSGHGVMHSPATGKIVADLILRGSTDLIDASVLSVERFAKGRAIQETAVL